MKHKLITLFFLLIILLHPIVANADDPLAFVSRGDPSAWDFGIGSGLTADGAWHDLDLSSIVTDSDAVAVEIRIHLLDGLAGKGGAVRKNGFSNVYNILYQRTQVGNKHIYENGMIECDDSQVIEYMIDSGMDTFHIVILGWWIPTAGGSGCPAHADTHEDGGSDEINVAGLSGQLADCQIPCSHASTHQDGGSDEINVGNLSGVLAQGQVADYLQTTDYPLELSVSPTVSDLLTWDGYSWVDAPISLSESEIPPHARTHEDGGSDEIDVEDLSGVLAEGQIANWLDSPDYPLELSVSPSISDVLTWDGYSWVDAEGTIMPEVITAVISGPITITSTWHYTETLSSGHDIAIIRSFTFGEASVAIALFSLLAFLGVKWIFELMRR